MPSWRAEQYLQFVEQRTRPCRDLAARLAASDPQTIVDLGCGPGNSTLVLRELWPQARITGLDSSPEMLTKARSTGPGLEWVLGGIAEWADDTRGSAFDLVFSNAALQWLPNHASLYPKLLKRVENGGTLAIQVPTGLHAPAHQIMRDLAASVAWSARFRDHAVREWFVHDAGFYYDVLASLCRTLEVWETEYIHVMPDAAAIGEWYRGTGLRPYLDALPSADVQGQFVADYVAEVARAYPERSDGRVLFPFRRLFLVAQR